MENQIEENKNKDISSQVREQMVVFWKEHSKKASEEEMMLDSNAELLGKLEIPEIISMLPDINKMDILELGAGIGRFSGLLAKKANSVRAIDFMENFLKVNREKNGQFKNLTIEQNDVTKLDYPCNSFDLVFSNWLLMYLEEVELYELFEKIFDWLRPGGYFFFRESCFHQSGNASRQKNPTLYRKPTMYNDMISRINSKKHFLKLLMTKSVKTYVKIKSNKNQICWLVQKVEFPYKNILNKLDSQYISYYNTHPNVFMNSANYSIFATNKHEIFLSNNKINLLDDQDFMNINKFERFLYRNENTLYKDECNHDKNGINNLISNYINILEANNENNLSESDDDTLNEKSNTNGTLICMENYNNSTLFNNNCIIKKSYNDVNNNFYRTTNNQMNNNIKNIELNNAEDINTRINNMDSNSAASYFYFISLYSNYLSKYLMESKKINFLEKIFGENCIQPIDGYILKDMINSLNITRESNVLVLGCGLGFITLHIAQTYGCHVVGVDKIANAIGIALERTNTLDEKCIQYETLFDFNNLNFEPETYDCIIYINYHGIQHFQKLFSTIKKIIKVDGQILLLEKLIAANKKCTNLSDLEEFKKTLSDGVKIISYSVRDLHLLLKHLETCLEKCNTMMNENCFTYDTKEKLLKKIIKLDDNSQNSDYLSTNKESTNSINNIQLNNSYYFKINLESQQTGLINESIDNIIDEPERKNFNSLFQSNGKIKNSIQINNNSKEIIDSCQISNQSQNSLISNSHSTFKNKMISNLEEIPLEVKWLQELSNNLMSYKNCLFNVL